MWWQTMSRSKKHFNCKWQYIPCHHFVKSPFNPCYKVAGATTCTKLMLYLFIYSVACPWRNFALFTTLLKTARSYKQDVPHPMHSFAIRLWYPDILLYYGSESWTINNGIQKQLEATEIWLLKGIMKVPLTARLSKDAILKQVNQERKLIRKVS
jgi:hypothetical protein